jgi:hypothetical protein
MDAQTTWGLIAFGVIVLFAVILMVWWSLRQVSKVAERRFGPVGTFPRKRKPAAESNCDCGRSTSDCECPPHERRKCVPARVTRPDLTPVAIYGVRDDDDCCNDGTRKLNRRQVQAMVDRANALALEREQAELDELLLDLRREPKSKSNL